MEIPIYHQEIITITSGSSQINMDKTYYNEKSITEHNYKNTSKSTILLLHYTLSDIDCPTCTCRTTNDLSELATADAVLFNVFHMPNDTIPRHAHPRQVFVYLNYEAQSRTYYIRSRHSSPFAFLNDYYNITMTFKDHPDTDIYVPYGMYQNRLPGIPIPLPSIYKIIGKTKYVVWIISNCDAPSSRMAYYMKLKKHIPIDIYGKCGPRACRDGCYNKIRRDYRFYLAFENSFCDSYATEKVS